MHDEERSTPDTGRGLSRRRLLALGSAALPASLLLPQLTRGQSFSESPIAPPAARTDPRHRFWKDLVDAFPLEPNRLHFDTAEYGIPPLQSLRRMHEAALTTYGHVRELDADYVTRARNSIARLVGARASEIALLSNAIAAMGLVADALPLEPGARVVLSTHEPASSLVPWRTTAAEKRLDLRSFVPRFDPDADVAAVEELLAPGGVLVVSHVAATQGSMMPLERLVASARRRSAFVVVNGSHAAGIVPVDVRTLGVDAYVASGHGWLLAPVGSAFAYVRESLLPRLRPRYHPAADEAARRGQRAPVRVDTAADLELSPYSASLAAGIEASIEWIRGFDINILRERTTGLASHLRDGLAALDGVDVLTPERAVESVPIVSFRIPRRPNTQVVEWLHQELGMQLQRIDTAGLNAVRASTYLVNQVRDADWLIEAARALA